MEFDAELELAAFAECGGQVSEIGQRAAHVEIKSTRQTTRVSPDSDRSVTIRDAIAVEIAGDDIERFTAVYNSDQPDLIVVGNSVAHSVKCSEYADHFISNQCA